MRRAPSICLITVFFVASPSIAQVRVDRDGLPIVPPPYGGEVSANRGAPPLKPILRDGNVETDRQRILQQRSSEKVPASVRDERASRPSTPVATPVDERRLRPLSPVAPLGDRNQEPAPGQGGTSWENGSGSALDRKSNSMVAASASKPSDAPLKVPEQSSEGIQEQNEYSHFLFYCSLGAIGALILVMARSFCLALRRK